MKLFIVSMVFLNLFPAMLLAQDNNVPRSDTGRVVPDTSMHKTAATIKLDNYAKGLQSKVGISTPLNQANQLKSTAAGKLKQADDAISKKLNAVKKPSVVFNLSVEEALKYQPAPVAFIVDPTQKFVNNVSVHGTVQAFGIPLNINFTNGLSGNPNPGLGGISNNLFRLDLDPAQFAGMFKSDIQQYYDLRKNAFGGLDLSGYTQKMVQQKLKEQETAIAGQVGNSALSQYLSDPSKVTALLNMNEDQMRQKLTAIAQSEVKKEVPIKELNNIGTSTSPATAANSFSQTIGNKLKEQAPDLKTLSGINPADPVKSLQLIAKKKVEDEQARLKANALKELSVNTNLQQYLSKPENIKQFQSMNEQQIAQRLATVSQVRETNSTPSSKYTGPIYVYTLPNVDISGYVRKIMAEYSLAHDEAVNSIAHKLVVAQQNGTTVNSANLFGGTSQAFAGISTKTGTVAPNKLNTEVDSIAKAITAIKTALQKQGVDVNKMLQIQKLMDQNHGTLPSTELAGSLLSPKPGSGLQSLLTQVQALKIGSFGSQVPGSTQGQDMFLQGTHVTFKLNNIPITAGYSSTNDITAVKDANYQSSAYNSPKNITYLGAKINQGVFGNVKFAVSSSFGTGVNNNTYSATSASSDNVAITMSKQMNMGKLGNVTLDVSKSTTLYNDNYQINSDVLLAQKAGISPTANTDLFEAFAIGVNHSLDIKEVGLSDNVYFNYAGMGYQNPGNSGFGGTRMKLGGNIRKSLYKNKLIVNLRSSISDMPISYTTNDQWKNYQVQLDSRYMVSKKFNMSFKYTANGTDKLVDDISTPVYSFQKIQIDGNATYKIDKYFTVSHFSIGKQDYNNSYVSASGGSMILVNYTQSTVINKNTLTANILYNKELSSLQILGNLFNSDVSYSYTIFQKVSMSSGLTFLNNTGIASQAGIRQSLQLMAKGNFDVGTYIDLRKNLITPLYPDLYSACRAELSLKYHIKN